MAVYSGTMVTAAGGLITILDTELIKNTNWSIYDASAGTNAKTYKCEDSANDVLFYLHVNDNQANYGICTLWETWNSSTHVGSGMYSQAASLRHGYTNYYLLLHEHHFIYINYTSATVSYAHFAGRLQELYEGERYYGLIGMLTSGIGYSPLQGYYSSALVWTLMKDTFGCPNQTFVSRGTPGLYENIYRLDASGIAHIPILYFIGPQELVFATSNYFFPLAQTAEFMAGDIITLDGDEWWVWRATVSDPPGKVMVRWI